MSIFKYSADQLYSWLTSRKEMTVLDVRNKVDFSRFRVESPYPFIMQNISYFDFMEIEDECVAKIGRDKPIRIVCAKEGSARYVAEILNRHGFDDVGYLEGGIKSWGNLLVPSLLNPDEEYQLYQFIRPGKASCSYGLINGHEMMLFDPSRQTDFYLAFAQSNNCTITKTFETHLQADYIAGSRLIADKCGARFMANENDFSGAKINYRKLSDGEVIDFARSGGSIRSVFTPGHTPGSTSFIIDEKFMLSGDTIFIHSVGRPDLGGQVDAWSDTLFETLQKIKSFDDNLIVLPAHYMEWNEATKDLTFAATLAQTKAFNRSIYDIDDNSDFHAFIKSNMREQPEEYATIRRINANLEQVDDDRAEELDLGKNECAASAYAAQQAQK
ncbi:MBL fold metallo-hydrolase [Desulforhopalus singaporensis]|uniref:Glyoxylase, beta-lactamase superfamily II n=1 Tax=Desulforhopalus singaporensis TaxID=91360 RepID=A0A1H0MQ57_9BACT|nr:MBL fold metallo-hydrolase [Desulforhopalus singaporensis]SDO82531.1 Glyoxylase, beta-lactamase superfamily II [Desulforhopalus singaporensis]